MECQEKGEINLDKAEKDKFLRSIISNLSIRIKVRNDNTFLLRNKIWTWMSETELLFSSLLFKLTIKYFAFIQLDI